MNSSQGPLRAGMGLFGWSLVLPVMVASIWYPYSQGDYVLAGLTTALAVGAILGHMMGAAKIVGFFVGSSIGMYYATPLGKECEPAVRSLLQQEGPIVTWVSQSVVVIGASFLCTFILQVAVAIFSAACPALQTLNQRLGFLLGGTQAVGVALFGLCGVLVLEPIAAKRLTTPADPNRNDVARVVCENVVNVAATVRPSRIGQCLAQVNPFERIEYFKNMVQGLDLFSDPAAFDRILKSPEMGKLAARPDLKQAFDELASTPQIQQLMKTGQGLDPQSITSLMANPAVLKLMNDPQVMAEIGKQSK